MKKLKLMTIVGTRPEIIKMSAIIKKSDKYFDHVLVHTGQNYDYNLNEVFFNDLGLFLVAFTPKEDSLISFAKALYE